MTDSNATELLPCPFCGGEAKICHVRDICKDPQDWYWGKCLSCRISGKHYPTEAEAIAAWNARAAVIDYDFAMAVHDGNLWRRIKDHIRCSYCGLNIESVIPLDGCNKNAIKHCPNCGKAVKR